MLVDGLKVERRLLPRDDWPNVLEWRNDPNVSLFMGTNRVISLAEHMDWFDRRNPELEDTPLFGYYLKEDLVASTRIDLNHLCNYEISVITHPLHRKKGLATYCLMDTLKYFKLLPSQDGRSIFARIHVQNLKSISLFTKVGFTNFSIGRDKFIVMRKII